MKTVLLVALMLLAGACTSTTVASESARPSFEVFCAAMTRPLGLDQDELVTAIRGGRELQLPDTARVFLRPDVSQVEIATVREQLSNESDITIIGFKTQEAAYEELVALSLPVTSSIEEMPPSFEVALRFLTVGSAKSADRWAAREEFLDRLRSDERVFEVVSADPRLPDLSDGSEVSLAELLLHSRLAPVLHVFMESTATASDWAPIEERLDALMTDYEFVDQAQAYERFQDLFRDSPTIAASAQLEDMSPSFHIRYFPELVEVGDEFRDEDAVFEVLRPELHLQQVAISHSLLLFDEAQQALSQANAAASPDQRAAIEALVEQLAQSKLRSDQASFYAVGADVATTLHQDLVTGCDYPESFMSRQLTLLIAESTR